MSDLSVFDVQRALRHFADIGHDILTDTTAVHVDGVPYRMALAHSLNMGIPNEPSLHSLISQKESPVISEFYTVAPRSRTDGFEWSGRRVHTRIPSRHEEYSDAYDEHPDYSVGTHIDHSWAPVGSILWKPFKENSQYKDIHEALRHHTEEHDAYKPFMWSHDRRPLTQEEYRGFNHKEALNDALEGATPHKGLVVVNHITGKNHKGADVWSRSLYNIHSEQLLPHDWKPRK